MESLQTRHWAALGGAVENSCPPLLSSGEAAVGCCIKTQGSQLERDGKKLERVLQRATMMGLGHGHVPCKEKQRELE